jgi:hypothetical protein
VTGLDPFGGGEVGDGGLLIFTAFIRG